MVLPRGEEEQLASATGFHALTAGLGKVGKTVLLKDDEREALGEGGTHDGLLALGDAGRNEDGSAAGLSKEKRHSFLNTTPSKRKNVQMCKLHTFFWVFTGMT